MYKKIGAIVLSLISAFSLTSSYASTGDQNLPNLAGQATPLAYSDSEEKSFKEFEDYFSNLCKNQQHTGRTCDKWSDKFDKDNRFNFKTGINWLKMHADAQDKMHMGNCRFTSAAIQRKLTELNFENYLLIFTNGGEEIHNTNLYRYNGEWFVADASTGINNRLNADNVFRSAKLSLKEFIIYMLRQGYQAIGVQNLPVVGAANIDKFGIVDIRVFNKIRSLKIGNANADILGIDKVMRAYCRGFYASNEISIGESTKICLKQQLSITEDDAKLPGLVNLLLIGYNLKNK